LLSVRLAILISLCVLIVAFSIGSFFVYENWRNDRYDSLIIEAANKHHVHPALLKAIVAARARFTYYARGEKGEVGLMQVPQEGVTEYKEYKRQATNDSDWDFGWVCINKAHPPHDETIRHNLPGTCNICRTPLVRGECYPKENTEMGAWYLDKLKTKLMSGIQNATQESVEDDVLIPLVIAAYCLTEETVRKETDNYRNPVLPPRLRNSIQDVLDMHKRYKQKGLK